MEICFRHFFGGVVEKMIGKDGCKKYLYQGSIYQVVCGLYI